MKKNIQVYEFRIINSTGLRVSNSAWIYTLTNYLSDKSHIAFYDLDPYELLIYKPRYRDERK